MCMFYLRQISHHARSPVLLVLEEISRALDVIRPCRPARGGAADPLTVAPADPRCSHSATRTGATRTERESGTKSLQLPAGSHCWSPIELAEASEVPAWRVSQHREADAIGDWRQSLRRSDSRAVPS